MIQDARVLKEAFVPQEIEHRNAEANALSRALRPAMDGEQPENAFLYGPSGAGKTCVARHTLEQLRQKVLDVETRYVNCWQHYTRFRALHEVLGGVGETFDVHRQSTPTDELLARLRDYDGPPYVVILDEVDQLEDESLLYDLYTLRNVSMLLIANSEEAVVARLSDRLRSRLHSARRVHFEAYTNDELVAILRARVRWGLDDDAVDRAQLRHIAETAAGDARVAIGVLRNAARTAQAESRERITDSMIEAATGVAREEIRQQSVEKLTPDQRVVYDVVAAREEVTPAVLYEEYESRVEDPSTKRTVRNWLTKMERYNLVEARGEKRGRTYAAI